MLIAAFIIWLTLLLLAVALCRAAASADSRHRELAARYPSHSTTTRRPLHSPPRSRTLAAGLILNDVQSAPAPRPARRSHGGKHALRI